MDCTATELRRGNRRSRINAGLRPKNYDVLGKRARRILAKMDARASRDGLSITEAADKGMYAIGRRLLQRVGLMRAA